MHPVLFHIGSVVVPSYGALAALGVLIALFLAQRTARRVGLDGAQVWNLCVVTVFTALISSRILLLAINWTVVRVHPAWVLALAMVHHPLLAGFGALAALVAAVVCGRWQQLPFWQTADVLAAPLAVGLAMEQCGALLAGSGYGIEASGLAARWAVTYTDPLAARWSGAPLGVAVHPVQLYAALAMAALAVLLLVWMPRRRRDGDVAGVFMLGAGTALFLTEFWRDTVGRGVLLHGALDGPQAAAVVLVLLGAFALIERECEDEEDWVPAASEIRGSLAEQQELTAKNEAAHE